MAKANSKDIRNALAIDGDLKNLGELQFDVLTMTSNKQFDEAVKKLETFARLKGGYPQYTKKTERLFEHAAELVRAIETKLNFPNVGGLNQTKQDELHGKTMENWEDLKLSLRRIRTIERDLLIEDAKSSIYVVRALLFSVIFLLCVWIGTQAYHTFGKSAVAFIKDSQEVFFEALDGR